MQFKNPANGHIETRSMPALWTLLFGGLYFIAVGVWGPLIIWFILAVFLFAAMGAPATMLMLVVNVVYALLSPGLVRSSYLRKGWIEVTGNDTVSAKAASNPYLQPYSPNAPAEPVTVTEVNAPASQEVLATTRRCPFCAEDIRVEAIKCKHCGSMIEPVTQGTQA